MPSKDKLNRDQIAAMLAEMAKGVRIKDLAVAYGVTRNTIRYHGMRAGLIAAPPSSRQARSDELVRLRGENQLLKIIVAEQSLEARLVGR